MAELQATIAGGAVSQVSRASVLVMAGLVPTIPVWRARGFGNRVARHQAIWPLPDSNKIFASANAVLTNYKIAKLARDGWRANVNWAAIIAACLVLAMLPGRPSLCFLYFHF
jgi:hypothetical protein